MSHKVFSISGLILSLSLTQAGFAKDFNLSDLKQATNPTFDLGAASKKMSYYDFVHKKVGLKMQELAPSASGNNEIVLNNGGGVSVKLSANNYNIHINFPNGPLGGRSYGWTSGQVGDWSDKMYLNNLALVVTKSSNQELHSFYQLIIQILGTCNANPDDKNGVSIDSLQNLSQRVATNFLAIYTAEQYRAMVPKGSKNWDDALLEVTMLGAFHGGQIKLTKFYLGKFSDKSKLQNPGVYKMSNPVSSPEKEATLNDYWQFSPNSKSTQSGIHLTNDDYEEMGQAITSFESLNHNAALSRIQAVVGKSNNVIKSISRYYTGDKAKDVANIDAQAKTLALSKNDVFSKDVAEFMVNIHDDANKISDGLLKSSN